MKPDAFRKLIESHDIDLIVSEIMNLKERIAKLPSEKISLYGLTHFEDAIHNSRLPEPLRFDTATFPVLSGLREIEPIDTLDELFAELLQVVEFPPTEEQVHRVIAGIFQFRHSSLDDYEAEIEQLRLTLDYLNHDDTSSTRKRPVHVRALIAHFLGIDVHWFDTKEESRKISAADFFSETNQPLTPYSITQFKKNKLQETLKATSDLNELIAESIQLFKQKKHDGLLSTPTHEAGWLNCTVFINRLISMYESGYLPGRIDLIHALLRLAPDFRKEILPHVKFISPQLQPVVRYALGEKCSKKLNDLVTPEVWLAAGRSRAPYSSLTELEELNIDPQLPDAIRKANWSFNPDFDPRKFKKGIDQFELLAQALELLDAAGEEHLDQVLMEIEEREENVKLKIQKKLSFINRPPLEKLYLGQFLPTVHLTQMCYLNHISYTICPACPDGALAEFCENLWNFIDLEKDNPRGDGPSHGVAHLAPLANPDRNWTELGKAAIWIGLSSNHRDTRKLVTEILSAAIEDGRVQGSELGSTLAELSAHNYLKLSRLLKVLSELTRSSKLASWIVCDMLETLINSWKKPPKEIGTILELLYQLMTKLQRSPSEETKLCLKKIKGSSKSAKLAKQLCTLESQPGSQAQMEAILQAYEGRLARAERVEGYLVTGK
ncbi:MAG: DUF6493 family protein [Planctomycetaceae bacterium]